MRPEIGPRYIAVVRSPADAPAGPSGPVGDSETTATCELVQTGGGVVVTSTSSLRREDVPSVVEYCVNNVDPETRDWLADCPVEERGAACLERCGTCRTTPFVVIDGNLRDAESHATLLDKLSEVTR